jgi:hypothetical protein
LWALEGMLKFGSVFSVGDKTMTRLVYTVATLFLGLGPALAAGEPADLHLGIDLSCTADGRLVATLKDGSGKISVAEWGNTERLSFAQARPEGNGHVDIAQAKPEGNGHVDMAQAKPEGNGHVDIAQVKPEGNGHIDIAFSNIPCR